MITNRQLNLYHKLFVFCEVASKNKEYKVKKMHSTLFEASKCYKSEVSTIIFKNIVSSRT